MYDELHNSPDEDADKGQDDELRNAWMTPRDSADQPPTALGGARRAIRISFEARAGGGPHDVRGDSVVLVGKPGSDRRQMAGWLAAPDSP